METDNLEPSLCTDLASGRMGTNELPYADRALLQVVRQVSTSTGDYMSSPDEAFVKNAITESEMLMRRLAEHTRSLKAHHNSLQPLCRLPTELISQIFQLHFPRTPAIGYDETDLALTHVCQRLRDVALNTPQAWTRLVTSCTPLAREMISRAKGLPLHVVIDYGLDYVDDDSPRIKIPRLFRDLVSDYFGVTQSFRLETTSRVLVMLARCFRNSAPFLLETLSITNASDDYLVLPYKDLWHLASSATLELRGCYFPFSTPVYRNLRCLKLERFDSSEEGAGNINDIFRMLHENPNLEELELSHATWVSDSSTAPTLEVLGVALSRLRVLAVKASTHTQVDFLSNVRAPNLERLHIIHANSDDDVIPDTEIRQLARCASKLLKGDKDFALRTLECDGEASLPEDGITMILGLREPDEDGMTRHVELTFGYSDSCCGAPILPVVQQLLSPWPQEHLTSVKMSDSQNYKESRGFCRFLSGLPALRHLHINNCYRGLDGLINVMQKDPNAFPALTTMLLSGIWMNGPLAKRRGQTVMEGLVACLSQREASGHGVTEVELKDCTFRPIPADNSPSVLLSGTLEMMIPVPRIGAQKSKSSS